jgi:hypothetical protein
LERRAKRRREGVAIRRAARLIDADLMFAETSARMCVEQKRWWVSDRRLTSGGWQQDSGAPAEPYPGDGLDGTGVD